MTPACQASLTFTISQSLLKLMSIESVMPSSHLVLCRPLLLLPPIPPHTRVFSNESTLHMRWPKYWSFRFSIIPSKEISGLISFRMDWLDLLAVQGTLKSLLQHHSSEASILRRLAFFTVQLSHPYMTTGKTIPWDKSHLVMAYFIHHWVPFVSILLRVFASTLMSLKLYAGRDWGQEEKGTTEDEMVGWHHRPNGHEFG